MAEYTPNLNLFKKDPVADKDTTFNIQTMLNDNWDKIDSSVKAALDDIGVLQDGQVRIATGSYVGTGTYGSSNPCSLTFDFPPKVVIMANHYGWRDDTSGNQAANQVGGIPVIFNMDMAPTEYKTGGYPSYIIDFDDHQEGAYVKKSLDGKTLTWYGSKSSVGQNNESRITYRWFAIG